MDDNQRIYNGNLIEDLCRIGEAVAEAYGPAFEEQRRLDRLRMEQMYHDCTPREAELD